MKKSLIFKFWESVSNIFGWLILQKGIRVKWSLITKFRGSGSTFKIKNVFWLYQLRVRKCTGASASQLFEIPRNWPTWSEIRRFNGSPAHTSNWMRPKSIPFPIVPISSHRQKMVIFWVTSNFISLTVNITSPEYSGDAESDMSDVRECQTKSEGMLNKFYRIDLHEAPFQVLLSKNDWKTSVRMCSQVFQMWLTTIK